MIPGLRTDTVEGAFVLFLGLALLIVLALFVTPIALVGIPSYLFYRFWRDHPARLERLAREQTEALLASVRNANVVFTETEIERALLAEVPAKTPPAVRAQLAEMGKRLFEAEHISADIPPPPPVLNSIEGARYRDMVARAAQAGLDRNMAISALATISRSLAAIARDLPAMEGELLVPAAQFLDKTNLIVADVIAPFFEQNDYNHFAKLRERLNANFAETHRTNPVHPSDYKGDDAPEIYLKGTPLIDLFAIRIPFGIPEATRFEHTHIIAGSGHGKTQTLQYHIVRDLEDISRGDKSVIVIDSQGDMISNLLRAKTVPPELIVLIDPEDIAFPVCLNLFGVGKERLATYGDLERERLTNSIIELYDFVLGTLLSAAMTPKQSVVFRYLTRLMLHIPDATIHTFRELLEPGGTKTYANAIAELDGTARSFFANEFDTKEFDQTRRQVLRRLYAVLENRTFERMFTHPRSKFDMFAEMNAGKLILINTAKSLLKEDGTEIFGRFFIALIAQAAQERATIPSGERTPVICYIDEAHEYFDQNIAVILSQARKYRVGMVMAHQFLGQLDSKLQEAFEANTSIKMAGGISMRDARTLSSQFNCDPDLLHRQKKGSLVTYVRGFTLKGVPIDFPFFALENLPRASREEMEMIRKLSRAQYAEPHAKKDAEHQDGDGEYEAPSRDDTFDQGDDTDPGQRSRPSKTAKDDKNQSKKSDDNDDDDPTSSGSSW
ncbi:type IV secretory system conjugative DNA transfer family protein [Oricola indica]|uniref:type IV secretory system conjugative DNA transfer family protein n=1 Tax=Oricola indica TaxID=2872591 RepID=UPI003CCC0F67